MRYSNRRRVPADAWHFAPAREYPRVRPRREPGSVFKAVTASLLVLGLLVAFIVAMTAGYRAHRAWVDACHAAGGVVTSTSSPRVSTAIVNGKVTTVISSDTTYYCIGAGGTLLGIRG